MVLPQDQLLKIKDNLKNILKNNILATPLKRQVDVNEICNAVDFFIKSRSITGQVIWQLIVAKV